MRKNAYILAVLLVTLLTSCDPYNKLMKSTDYELKRKKALEYYEKKSWDKALGLLEDVLPVYRYTAHGAEIYYKFAKAHYEIGDYYLGGYYFKSFAKAYPASDKVEECLFMSAMCHVELSPPYYLDQEDTKKAVSELQEFMNRFPESNRRDTCNLIMDKLRLKLDTKEYEGAKLYLKTEQYKAAVVAFNAILESNPGTFYKENIMLYRVEAAYNYAKYSIPTKKAERLEQTMGFYTKFVAAFPTSAKLEEARVYNDKAKQELESIK